MKLILAYEIECEDFDFKSFRSRFTDRELAMLMYNLQFVMGVEELAVTRVEFDELKGPPVENKSEEFNKI